MFALFLRASVLAACVMIVSIVAGMSIQLPVDAQTVASGASGSVVLNVSDPSGAMIAGAVVTISGQQTLRGITDTKGTFSVSGVKPGAYAISVTRPGFAAFKQDSLVVLESSPSSLTVTMQPLTFSSLQVIGSTSSAGSTSSINTSPADISRVTGAGMIDRGQSILQALNTIPGFSGTTGGGYLQGVNGAVPATGEIPQIRGALPYETASLIDGHPIAFGSLGYYNPNFLSPYVLESVDVVKGPGATPTNINYAIAGTVNYRTLQPTKMSAVSFDAVSDSQGGLQANLRATGTVNSKLGYAFDYYVDGSPGPLRNYQANVPYIPTFYGTPTIDGQPVCAKGSPASCYSTSGPGPSNIYGSSITRTSLFGCCTNVNSNYLEHNELAKVVYNFSPQTSLGATFLGIQGAADQQPEFTFFTNNTTFNPPAGYTGSVFAGTNIPNTVTSLLPYMNYNRQQLFESDFRTSFGGTTVLARAYTASLDNLTNAMPTTPGSYNLNLYGGIYLGATPTLTIFNGTPATLTLANPYFPKNELDQLTGLTGEIDQLVGNQTFTLSYDHVRTTTSAHTDQFGVFITNIPDGSGQTFQTLRAQALLSLDRSVNLSLSDYQLQFTNHVSPTGNGAFTDSTSSYNAPRASLTWHPAPAVSYRLSMGSSVAPPYVSLITTASAPLAYNTSSKFYTEAINAANVLPETAFTYDLGGDLRLNKTTTLSLDGYTTNLRNLLLKTTSYAGIYTPPATSPFAATGPFPLYITGSSNLGQAQYRGLELQLKKQPLDGIGYNVNFALERAYTYNLPPNFYNAAGGSANTANLAITPNVNFPSSSSVYQGLSAGAIPYSQGYGEINYRKHDKLFATLGATYNGPNNPYNYAAFFVVNASVRYNLNPRLSLLLSGYNLNSVHSELVPNYEYNGPGLIQPPLANGQVGEVYGGNIGPAVVQLSLHYQLGR